MVNGEVGQAGDRAQQHVAAVNNPDHGRVVNRFLHLVVKLARGIKADNMTVTQTIVQVRGLLIASYKKCLDENKDIHGLSIRFFK